jgi:hypothetical protein
MKVFIVFLSLLIVNVSALVFQGDLGNYMHEQLLLKEAAEECAAGAAILIDEEEYSYGRITFDYQAGEKYAEEYLEYIKRNSRVMSKGEISCELTFEDDNKGYSTMNIKHIPSITSEIVVKTNDVFRVPFIEVTRLERSARYELPNDI